MNINDTYEFGDIKNSLEKYEWDDVWHEQTDISDKYRVFYIGDSISRGIRRRITAVSDGEILCSGYATSKGLDNPFFKDMIRMSLAGNKYDTVLFNNGLHGWHLSEGEYAERYDEMVDFLLNELGLPLRIVTTTKTNDAHAARAEARNAEALAVAKKYGVQTVDLYSASAKIFDSLRDDGIHFSDEGYDELARYIKENLK